MQQVKFIDDLHIGVRARGTAWAAPPPPQILGSTGADSLRADEIKLWLTEFSYRLHAG